MIYKPKHFKPEEFLDPQTFKKWGADGLRYMDQALLAAADWIWEHYPAAAGKRKIVCNDWDFGGNKRWRGLRLPGSEYYREYSAHASGRALDLTVHGVSVPEMQAWIGHQHRLAVAEDSPIRQRHPILAIRRMETIQDAPTWLHLDTLEHDKPDIIFIRRTI